MVTAQAQGTTAHAAFASGVIPMFERSRWQAAPVVQIGKCQYFDGKARAGEAHCFALRQPLSTP